MYIFNFDMNIQLRCKLHQQLESNQKESTNQTFAQPDLASNNTLPPTHYTKRLTYGADSSPQPPQEALETIQAKETQQQTERGFPHSTTSGSDT